MTKQELREGIALIIFDWETCATDATDNYGLADKILKYIKSKGGVIKVDRELNELEKLEYIDMFISGKKFRYVAVEELI